MSGQEGKPGEELLSGVSTEIGEEVRRRRMTGELLPSFEQQLDEAFAALTPDRHHGAFGRILDLAGRSSFVDLEAPVRSNLPGGELVKRGVRSILWWYLDYVMQQVTVFASASTRLAQLLDERVSQLEGDHEGGPDDDLVPPFDHEPWIDLVLASTGTSTGPILHADCADGRLLDVLVDNGAAAYGAGTKAELLDQAARRGRDVRLEDPLRHLHGLEDSSLGGVVLSGCPDTRKLSAQRGLIQAVGAKVRPGGVVVLLGTSPGAWARAVPVVAADLSVGRPLHAETWRHLMLEHGLGQVEVHPGTSDDRLVPVSEPHPADPMVATMNDNLDKLNDLLFGPTTFAVVGVRGD